MFQQRISFFCCQRIARRTRIFFCVLLRLLWFLLFVSFVSFDDHLMTRITRILVSSFDDLFSCQRTTRIICFICFIRWSSNDTNYTNFLCLLRLLLFFLTADNAERRKNFFLVPHLNHYIFLRISAYSAVQYFQISWIFLSSCPSCSPLAPLTMSDVSRTFFVPS